ncbi:ABC transporter permease [Fodinicola feengrottensis]|uniref:Transport permease protein n=1 Tax=Fodinicola feengrottensis TaxID=435914 RepID=A0ABN2FZQ3_9ACTN
MNPSVAAVGAGFQRGWIEFRQTVTNAGQAVGWLFLPVVGLVVMYLLRGTPVPGTDFSLGARAIPGILGFSVVMTGLMGLALALTMDREDGTLLRAKATPNGMLGYVTGKVVSQAGMTIGVLIIVLIPAALLFQGLQLDRASSWLNLAWVLALGLVATLPIGAMLGSLFPNTQGLSFLSLLVMGLVMISGVFYPITGFPGWLQWVAQVFPLYWLGLGMRWALLPDALSAAELGGSWRQLEMVAVLGAWAVFGFVTAPIVLRRMARRESGSRVAARKDKAIQQW